MKKKTAIILISCLVLLAAAVFLASNLFHMGKMRLSLIMTNEECKQFLLDRGVIIPEEFSDLNFRDAFADIEKNPDIVFIYGWVALGDFATEIRDVLNAYYGITPQGG